MGTIEYFNKYFNNLLNSQIYNINTDLNKVNTSLNSLQNSSIVSVNNLNDKVNKENQKIDESTSEKYNESTKVQSVNLQYDKLELNRIKNHNSILFIIYYILILLFSIILFYKQRFLNLYRNIGIVLLLLSYPFIINILEYIKNYIIYF